MTDEEAAVAAEAIDAAEEAGEADDDVTVSGAMETEEAPAEDAGDAAEGAVE